MRCLILLSFMSCLISLSFMSCLIVLSLTTCLIVLSLTSCLIVHSLMRCLISLSFMSCSISLSFHGCLITLALVVFLGETYTTRVYNLFWPLTLLGVPNCTWYFVPLARSLAHNNGDSHFKKAVFNTIHR